MILSLKISGKHRLAKKLTHTKEGDVLTYCLSCYLSAKKSSNKKVVENVRVHFSALISEQVCASLSQTKNRVKDEGRTNNQLRVRAQALQPERLWPLDEEVLRGGGV